MPAAPDAAGAADASIEVVTAAGTAAAIDVDGELVRLPLALLGGSSPKTPAPVGEEPAMMVDVCV